MSTPTETPEALVARAEAWRAEHWSEKCPVRNLGDRHPAGERCPFCQGSNVQYPFRVKCNPTTCSTCELEVEHRFRLFRNHDCHGLDYLPTVTDTSLGEALRRRGWILEMESNPNFDGDVVSIYPSQIMQDIGGYCGQAKRKDHLRDHDARIVAAARACGMPDA